MDKEFNNYVRSTIALELNCNMEDVYTVWQCKTLQNIKGLYSSSVPAAKGFYWEATYNGDMHELYFDKYKKELHTTHINALSNIWDINADIDSYDKGEKI